MFLGKSSNAVSRALVACLIASCSGKLTASEIDLAILVPSGAKLPNLLGALARSIAS